jgi:hypothetical protein
MDADEAAVTAADGRACGCMNPTQSGKTASMECTILMDRKRGFAIRRALMPSRRKNESTKDS